MGDSLVQEIQELEVLMKQALKEAKDRGKAWSLASAHYSGVKARAALAMRDEGMPVGIIEMTIKGDEEVNKAMLDRDEKQVLYKNAVEAIQAYKLLYRTKNEEYQRLWGDSK